MVVVLYLVIAVGAVAVIGGGVWFLKIAFDTSAGWGLACLVPFVGLIFLVKKWEACRLPFFINFAGVLTSLVGTLLLAGYTANAEVKDLARVEWDEPAPITTQATVDDTWHDEPAFDDEPEPDDPEPDTGAYVAGGDFDLIPTATPAARREWPTDLIPEQADRTPTPLPHWMRKWGDQLERGEYVEYLDAVIQVSTNDRQVFKAVLIGVYTESIKVRQRVGNGFVEFYVNDDTIIEVRARKK